jgi:hypothetical protein
MLELPQEISLDHHVQPQRQSRREESNSRLDESPYQRVQTNSDRNAPSVTDVFRG